MTKNNTRSNRPIIKEKVFQKVMEDAKLTENVNIEVDDISYKEVLETSRKSIWTNDCKNKRIVQMPIDARGRYGEHICKNVLDKYKGENDKIEYYEGAQGDWDVKFNNIRIEVKTATLDSNGKFQNENIKMHKLHSDQLPEGSDLQPFDILVFIGVSPNNHSFKVVKYSDIPFDSLHNRGKAGTGAAYKWDSYYWDYTLMTDTKDLYDAIISAIN